MKRLIYLLILLACLSPLAAAQNGYVTIVATVRDPTGALYVNSQVGATFFDPGTGGKLPLLYGSTFQTNLTGYGTDSFAHFSLQVADNQQIAASSGATGTSWRFTITYQDRATSFTYQTPIDCIDNIPVTCNSGVMDISAPLQAVAALLPSVSGGNFIPVNISPSATPTFNANSNTTFNYTLNQNVTSSTFVTNPASGQTTIFQFNICQDVTGNHTMVWPLNVTLPSGYAVLPNANSCSPVAFIYNPFTSKWGPWQAGSNTGTSLPFQSIPFSATPSFIGTASAAYGMTLTGNVTVPVISGTPVNGNIIKFHLCQGAGGPWTFAFPSNFLNTTAIQNTGCTDETYSFDGTNWSQLTQPVGGGGGGGGSCSSVGAQGTLQAAGTVGTCQSTNLVETSNDLAINEDTQFKGPNPWIDMRAFARIMPNNTTPVLSGITATCTSGLATVTLSSLPTTAFANGDGVNILHCGANNSGTTPGAPLVFAGGAASGTNTRIDKPSSPPAAGSTSYTYFAVGITQGRGTSLPSAGTTITNGQASLGTQTVTNTSITAVGNVATVTTSATHTIAVGYEVNIFGVTDGNGFGVDQFWGGNYTVASVPDSTHYTYILRQSVTNGGPISASGGTTTWNNLNHVSVTAVGSYDSYAIYGGPTGSASLICFTGPVNSNLTGDQTYLACDDNGPLSANLTVPEYLSSSLPVSATNDSLTTTIVSGAGTTSMTLNATAGTNGTNPIHYDAGPNYIAAANYANSIGAFIYFPITTGNNNWFNDSYVLWPNGTKIRQAGSVQLGDTWNGNFLKFWKGVEGAPCVKPQFALVCAPNVLVQAAYPGFYSQGSPELDRLTFSSGTTNDSSPLVLLDYPNDAQASNLNFGGSGSNSEYLFTGLELRGNSSNGASPFVDTFTNLSFTGGPAQVNSSTGTPLFYCNTCGPMIFDHISVGRRGLLFRAPSSGTNATIHFIYNQGGINPLIRATYADSGGASVALKIDNLTQDTSSMPIVSSFLGAVTSVVLTTANGPSQTPTGPPPSVTGAVAYYESFAAGNRGGIGGVNTNNCSSQVIFDPIFFPFLSFTTEGVCSKSTQTNITPGYGIYTSDVNNVAPSCSVATAGPPFTPAGTYSFQIAADWYQHFPGTMSPRSNTCVSNGTTQQITVTTPTVPPGANGWDIFGALGPMSISFPSTTNTSFLVTLGPNAGGGIPSVASGGNSGFRSGAGWSLTYNLAQYEDISETAAPANPVIGFDRLYANSTTHGLKCITSAGNNCFGLKTFNSYSSNHTPNINEDGLVATATLTFTLPHAVNNWGWDIESIGGTTTLAIDSGNLYVGGAVGPITIPTNQGVHAWCDGTNCYAYGLGGGSGGGSPGGSTNAFQYNGGGGSFAGVNSPIINGNYNVHYRVIANVSVPPAIDLPGIPINPQTGTSYTMGTGNTDFDRGYLITANNSGAQTYTLVNPTSTGFGSNYFNALWNIGTGIVTENASGFTINGLTSLSTPPSWVRFMWSNGVNYSSSRFPDYNAFPASCTTAITIVAGVFGCGASGSVSSWSGDGALYNNVSSTGAVTATLAAAGANTVWGRCTTSSGTPSYCQINDPMLTAVSHAALFNISNVWASLQDFSAATVKIPTGAGFVANASSMIGYDTTNKNIHLFQNGADSINCGFASSPANNNVIIAVVASSNVLCSGVTALPNGTTATTQAIDDNSTNIATTAYVDRMNMRSLGWAFGDLATGSTLTTSEIGYITVPYACAIVGYHIMTDAGTVTIKTARVNGGTALPTIGSNSISTSGVSLSTGTKIDSTTVTDFTSTAIAANDTLGFFITAVATAKQITFQIDCKQ